LTAEHTVGSSFQDTDNQTPHEPNGEEWKGLSPFSAHWGFIFGFHSTRSKNLER